MPSDEQNDEQDVCHTVYSSITYNVWPQYLQHVAFCSVQPVNHSDLDVMNAASSAFNDDISLSISELVEVCFQV